MTTPDPVASHEWCAYWHRRPESDLPPDLGDRRRKNRLVHFLQMAHREYLDEGTVPPNWEALVRRASEYGAQFGFAPHRFQELGDWTLRDMLDA